LSQGKLGEDTTALLGAMFITKMQLTAMGRVNLPAEKRSDFYMYVDEFQNFATTSFIKILSEARKYRLNLILANQYIGQVEEGIQKAIFGNVGTLVTFLIGAGDATHFEKEFGGKFSVDDLVGLGKFQVLMKMAINGLTSEPFVAYTLPLPKVVNNNKDKIIRLCLEKYYRKVETNVNARPLPHTQPPAPVKVQSQPSAPLHKSETPVTTKTEQHAPPKVVQNTRPQTQSPQPHAKATQAVAPKTTQHKVEHSAKPQVTPSANSQVDRKS
jgi:hypothetical protein